MTLKEQEERSGQAADGGDGDPLSVAPLFPQVPMLAAGVCRAANTSGVRDIETVGHEVVSRNTGSLNEIEDRRADMTGQ